MKCRRATVDRHAVGGSTIGSDGPFKGRDRWTLGQPVALENLDDGFNIILGYVLASIRNHGCVLYPVPTLNESAPL